MPPASLMGDDHAAIQQDSIYALIKFSDPITEDRKKITKRSYPSKEAEDMNLMSKKEQGLEPGILLLLQVDDEVDAPCLLVGG